MNGIRNMRRIAASLVLAFGFLGAAGSPAVPAVSVALVPTALEVTPGSTFELSLMVTQPGTAINGFDAVIGYDPAALTLLPYDPVWQQEGSLLLGACGNTFHRFSFTPGEVQITDVLLCNGVALTGPGQIYRLRFQASSTPQFTNVTFLPGLQFYNEGVFVNPAVSYDAVIGIGMTPVSAEPTAPLGLSLRIAPNPAMQGTVFTIEAERAGPQKSRVFDARGRMVWRNEDSLASAGTRRVAWNGRGTDGKLAPAGTYLVRLEAGGRAVSERISLLR